MDHVLAVSMFFLNVPVRMFIEDYSQQEEQGTMRSKDTEFAAVKLPPRCLLGWVKLEWGRLYIMSRAV